MRPPRSASSSARVTRSLTMANSLATKNPLTSTSRIAESVSARSFIQARARRSEEHTSELQSLMRISYAVLCLKQQNRLEQNPTEEQHTNHHTLLTITDDH